MLQKILLTIKLLSDINNLKAIYSAIRPMVYRALWITVGAFVGIYSVYGIGALQVKWRNAEPVHLADGYKDQWVKNTAVIFANGGITEDAETQAKNALETAGYGPSEIESLAQANPNLAPALETIKDLPSQSVADDYQGKVSGGIFANIMPIFCLIGYFILFVVLGVLWAILKTFGPFKKDNAARSEATQGLSESERQRREALQAAKGHVEALDTALGEPVASFMSAYVLGDDLYDDSFAIEPEREEGDTRPGRDFAGECGMGVSETIGVGDPKKVTAFEAWVFDQAEIQTLTYVLMSEHAYNDPALRAKLAPRGEPVMLQAGQTIWLETKTLKMQVRIIDLEYGEGSLPPNSFFSKVTFAIAVWVKEGASVGGGDSAFAPPPPMGGIQPTPDWMQEPSGGQPLTGNMPTQPLTGNAPMGGQPLTGNMPPQPLTGNAPMGGQPLTGNMPPQPLTSNAPMGGQPLTGNMPPQPLTGNAPMSGQPLTGNMPPQPLTSNAPQQPLTNNMPGGGIRPLTSNAPQQPPMPARQPSPQAPSGQSPAPGRAPLSDDFDAPSGGRRPPDDPFGDTSQM